MFNENEVMDGLIDIEDQKAMQTSPEPESMLDSVFNETMTPEEEYTQALLSCNTPGMKIKAYGTELEVELDGDEPVARGLLEFDCKNCASLSHRDFLTIRINRHWIKNEDGTIKRREYYYFRLSMFSNQTLFFNVDSETYELQRAFDKVLDMREIAMKGFTLKDFLARNGAWCM